MNAVNTNAPTPFVDLSCLNRRPVEVHVATDPDLLQLFSYIKDTTEDSYFFESLVMPEHQDRYYTIGFNPALTFRASNNVLSVNGDPNALARLTNQLVPFKVESDNPYRLLQQQFTMDFNSERHRGGLIGYTSYESVNYFGMGLSLKEHDDFGTFCYGLYLEGFVYDSQTGLLTFYTYDPLFNDKDLAKIKAILKNSEAHVVPTSLSKVEFKGHSETREEFIDAVSRTQKKIQEGYSFQSEVGFKSYYDIKGDKFAIYKTLREVNPSPYMFYVKFNNVEILGASPEILISSHHRDMLTTPTAGTTTRGETPDADRKLARALLSDPKEIAEHNMLVDLHRNDMAVVAEAGTVNIKDLMYLIKFSHVQHIVTDVAARQAKDKDAFDVLAAILPGGVVTGAPKIETIKIIDENEATPRGIYGGAVGRFSLNGDSDHCLPIRSIFCVGDKCYAQTSAGIVYDSIPENEFEEVINKLAAMKQTLCKLGGK